ncbi:oligosaccharide repeat unit polymerase [Vibrio vulnificus]|nr:oligosaccharide repeat unit polymerase [Vibrio vulnificus]
MFEKVKFPKIGVVYVGSVIGLKHKSDRWFIRLYIFVLFIMLMQIYVRYITGTLVIGQESTGGNSITVVINYLLYALGLTHTGYLNYTGLILIGVIIFLKSGTQKYIIFSVVFMLFLTILTTQKSYVLYAVVSWMVFTLWILGGGYSKNIKYALILTISPIGIFLLNSLRNVKLETSTSIFEYFSLDTILWYMAIRADYSLSSSYIVGGNFESSTDFLLNTLKSLLFFLPKSILFGNDIYSIRLAQYVGYSDNELAGITITPFAQIYSVGGIFGSILLALLYFILIKCYERNYKDKQKEDSVTTVFFLLPMIFFGSMSQAIPELIYVTLRSIFSLNFILLLFFILDKVFLSVKKIPK